MEPSDVEDSSRLQQWFRLLYYGEGFQGSEARERALTEMRDAGAKRLFPLLVPMLGDHDCDVRCKACHAILWTDAGKGLELVLPLLSDADTTVRWHVCGLLHDFGDTRALDALLERLKKDTNEQVRGTAAFALGGIGSPRAIPALVETMESDHAVDQLGHTPSSCAATALDDILGTNETRLRLSDPIRTMRAGTPDLDKLKRRAMAAYRRWQDAQSA
jgi:HEAT repeat protein